MLPKFFQIAGKLMYASPYYFLRYSNLLRIEFHATEPCHTASTVSLTTTWLIVDGAGKAGRGTFHRPAEKKIWRGKSIPFDCHKRSFSSINIFSYTQCPCPSCRELSSRPRPTSTVRVMGIERRSRPSDSKLDCDGHN